MKNNITIQPTFDTAVTEFKTFLKRHEDIVVVADTGQKPRRRWVSTLFNVVSTSSPIWQTSAKNFKQNDVPTFVFDKMTDKKWKVSLYGGSEKPESAPIVVAPKADVGESSQVFFDNLDDETISKFVEQLKEEVPMSDFSMNKQGSTEDQSLEEIVGSSMLVVTNSRETAELSMLLGVPFYQLNSEDPTSLYATRSLKRIIVASEDRRNEYFKNKFEAENPPVEDREWTLREIRDGSLYRHIQSVI